MGMFLGILGVSRLLNEFVGISGHLSGCCPIDNKNMSFTSQEGGQHIPKVNSLAQFARKPLLTHTYQAESKLPNGAVQRTLPDEKD